MFSAVVLAGGAPFSIKLPEKPTVQDKTAAKELEHYLGKTVKSKITVGGVDNPVFYVGAVEEAKSMGINPSALKSEEWVIKSKGGKVVLVGGGTRGTLYAVYNFIENQLGVHWWSPREEYIPSSGNISLPELDLKGKPFFMYRDIYRTNEPDDKGRFAVRNRLNRNGDAGIGAAYGGAFNYGPPYHCHTFNHYIPYDKYSKTNPQWFSLVNGKRAGGQFKGQLCLSNPELKEVFAKKLREYIKQGEENAEKLGVPAPKLYDLSQNDNKYPCECEKCKAMTEKYGASGLLLLLINSIAKEIKKDYPDILIRTLAYFHTETLPRNINPDDNVIISLCDTMTNQAASINSPENAQFREKIEGWSKISKNLFIWDYAITFDSGGRNMPFASEFDYGDLYRFYADNKVTGIFWEHEYPYVADMYTMKLWLEMKFLENPYADKDKLIETFLSKYYGKAGNYIKEYRQSIAAAARKNKAFISWFATLEASKYIDLQTLIKCHEIMDKAEKAVSGNPVLLERVQFARLSLDRLTYRLGRYYASKCRESGKSTDEFAKYFKKSCERSQEIWLKTTEGLAKKTDILNFIEQEKSYANIDLNYEPPAKFAGQNYLDFTADAFRLYRSASKYMRLVRDHDAGNGTAVWIDADAKRKDFALPMAIGAYDAKNKKLIKTLLIPHRDLPKNGGYKWYSLGTLMLNKECYIYFTRNWQAQLPLPSLKEKMEQYTVWAKIKVEGPLFYPRRIKKGKSSIYINRVVLVK
jgi:hypothetical protein